MGAGEGAGSRGQRSRCVGSREGGRACAGVDGERSESPLSIPSDSLLIEGCFSRCTLYQRLNL